MKLFALLFLAATGLQAAPADAPAAPPITPPPAKAKRPAPAAAKDTPAASLKKAALAAPDKTPMDALPAPPPPWRVSAGPQFRQIGSLTFHGAVQAGIPASTIRGNPPQIGDSGVVGNRTYNDGFVRTDISGSSSTWNWGYNNASQSAGTTLSFHATGTALTGQAFNRSFDTNWNDDPSGAGAFVKLESPEMYRSGKIGFSGEFGYSFTHGSSGNTGEAFQGRLQSDLRSITVTDRYDTTGVVVPVAPYAGTFNGPGPIISNRPSSRTIATTGDSQQQTAITSTLRSHLTTNLHTFSFGADAHEDIGRFRLGFSTGLALNITNWDASTHEDVRNSTTGAEIQSWDYHHRGTDLHPGFYLEANASVPITERLSFVTSGRYDWAGSLHGNVNGSSFDLALGGWTLTAGLSLKF